MLWPITLNFHWKTTFKTLSPQPTMATLASYRHFKQAAFAALENKGLTIITLGDVRLTINNDNVTIYKNITMGYVHSDTTVVGTVPDGRIVRNPGARNLPLDGLALMSEVVHNEEKKLWFYRSNLLPDSKEMFNLMCTNRSPAITIINSRIPREYRSASAADRHTCHLLIAETNMHIADILCDLFLASISPAINADIRRVTEKLLTKVFPHGVWEIIMSFALDTLSVQTF